MRHTKSTTTIQTTPSTSSNVMPLNSMESLQLPAELIWDGKSEPNTPPSGELFSIVDYSIVENWIDEDNIAIEIIDTEQLSTIEEACELIDGDELVKELCNLKEETWNNAKPQPTTPNYVDEYMVDFSQSNPLSKVLFQTSLDGFNSLPGIASVGVDEFYTPVANNINNNNNNLDNAVLTQLTPPQSPPLNNNSIINNTQPFFSTDSQFNIIEQQPILLPTQQPQTTFIWNNNPSITAPLPTTIQSTENYLQTQIVDEIVKTRAQELSDWSDEFEALSSSSISSFTASINTDDSSIEQQQPVETSTTSTGSKKRRPYGRAIEDRKVRKKEQNKNAATRYRQKKKMEMEVVLSEEHELLKRNEELKRQLLERRKEAKYLKTLLREFQEKKLQLKQKA